MAIYSLHHQPVGKSTQARPYTSAAHVRYIMRRSAVGRVEAARMPATRGRAARFMERGEQVDRKNARVADKVLLALPRELNGEQRAQLVRGYAEAVTQGRAPWLAAFHDKGKDAHNPHAHLVVRDRDPDTAKRVAGLSEKGSTERLREVWEEHVNRALEAAGCVERIDRRTLKAQGIDRPASIHEGPRAQQMDKRGVQPESHVRDQRNAPGALSPSRSVDYVAIDKGRSRPAYNRALAPRETEASFWAAIDAHMVQQELEHLRNVHIPPASVNVRRSLRPPSSDKRLVADNQRADLRPTLLGLRDESLVPSVSPRPDARIIKQPRSDNRQPHQNRPNHFLGEETNPTGNSRNHGSSIPSNNHAGKDSVMEDKDRILAKHKEDTLQKEFNNNKSQSLLNDTMNRAFYDPNAAMKKMNQYADKEKSREALYNKLGDKKQVFGRRPGSILSKDGFKAGAEAKRRDADVARQQLPHVLRQADKNQTEWANSRKAYKDALDRYSPNGGGDGGPPEGQGTPQPKPSAGQGAGGGPADGQAQQSSNQPKQTAERQEAELNQKPKQAHQPTSHAAASRPQAQQGVRDNPDKQNNEARRQMQERLSREQHPAYAKNAERPQERQQPVQQDKDRQNNDARRKMMDQMRDRQAKEKELEKQKGKVKGVGE